jgi:hypothetical protein
LAEPGAVPPPTVHATAVLCGRTGVLLRGPSGAGKSRLALALITEVRRAGGFAALIGDDRVVLSVHGGRLVARPAPVLAGRIELRGVGIGDVVHEPAAVIGLLVDLLEAPPERLPAPETCRETVAGIVLARLGLWREDPAALLKVMAVLADFGREGTRSTQFDGYRHKGT